MDQRWVEYQLENSYKSFITSIRLTLTQCFSRYFKIFLIFKFCFRLSLSLEKELLIDNGKYIVAVVYFRSGYEPSSYPSNKEWDARLLIERSKAIKCPWIGLQLANTKKIQQAYFFKIIFFKYLNFRN